MKKPIKRFGSRQELQDKMKWKENERKKAKVACKIYFKIIGKQNGLFYATKRSVHILIIKLINY